MSRKVKFDLPIVVLYSNAGSCLMTIATAISSITPSPIPPVPCCV